MLENRTKIGRRLTDQFKMLHIFREFPRICHLFVRTQLIVALQNTQVEMPEKASVLLQKLIGAAEERAHEFTGGRHRGINGNDEILDFPHLPRL